MRLKKAERAAVYAKYDGRCAYCGCELGDKWHADHLEPVRREMGKYWHGKEAMHVDRHNIDNMMPACAPCNISKSSMDLDFWRGWLEGHVESLRKYHKIFRMAEAYGLVQETGVKVVFHFEKVAKGESS